MEHLPSLCAEHFRNMTETKRRFPWIVYAVVLSLILLVALAPIICVIIAAAVASSHGCQLDEGSVHPCVIAGHDYGETLYTLGVMGWLMLVTLPAGAFAGLVWLVILLVHFASRAKARRTESTAV